MSDDAPPEVAKRAIPAWVMTFADLMTLLMCFFVLLLSFSEMDLQKFKQVAGSMEKAFGVQRDFKNTGIPRGTSIIAQEFSPGRPEPTPINEIRQFTTDDIEDLLKIEQKNITTDSGVGVSQELEEELAEELESGAIEMSLKEDRVIIRINEKGSFTSGSATLRADFVPVLEKISKILAITPGKVTVSGYTDDVPIQTDLFRSNWELSAIRSFAVLNELLKNQELNAKKFTLEGNASNKPVAPNDSSSNRSKNRRVELVITQDQSETTDDIITIDDDADTYKIPGIEQIESQEYVSTFPPLIEETTDGSENYLEDGDLGVFKEDALYDYEIKDDIEVPVPGEPDTFKGGVEGFVEEVKVDETKDTTKTELIVEELEERGFDPKEK